MYTLQAIDAAADSGEAGARVYSLLTFSKRFQTTQFPHKNWSFIFSSTCSPLTLYNFTNYRTSSNSIRVFNHNNIVDTNVSSICIQLSTRNQRREDISLPVYLEIIHYSLLHKLSVLSTKVRAFTGMCGDATDRPLINMVSDF